jgi:integrase
MPKLTKRSVEALRVQATNYIAFDAELPGFGVRIMPSGKRFFLVQYRRHGRTRRVMLGQFGPLTAEVARRRALMLLAQVRSGGSDPAAERDALRQSLTVEQLGARFLKEHVAVRCKPTTQSEYRRSVELFIDPFLGKQRIRSVTTADVAELHGSLSYIPYQANRTLGVISKMMNLAEIWGLRDRHSNPCEDIQRYPERKRERFLSLQEVKALGRVLDEAESDGSEGKYACTAFRLLLLTGCRLSEIQKLKWAHVYLDERELRLPDSKTGAKTVHLGAAAIALLRSLPQKTCASTTSGTRAHPRPPAHVRFGWSRCRPMIGKLLGHTQVRTMARYAHLAADPVKQAAEKIAERLAGARLNGPTNVLPGHEDTAPGQ